jgi:excisionase family DNA binding protein
MTNTLTITQELSPESLESIRKMMAELLSTTIQTKSEEDALFTIDEAAAFLSVKVCTVRSSVRAKHFKAYKKNKLLYFSKQELTEWIKSSPRKPGVRFKAR